MVTIHCVARCFEDILAIAETVARIAGSTHVARTLFFLDQDIVGFGPKLLHPH